MSTGRGGSELLADDVDQVLEHLVAGGNDARGRLEAALRKDDVGELLGQVDVRGLERARAYRAAAVRVRQANDRLAGVRARRPEVLSLALEATGVRRSWRAPTGQ